MRKTSRVIIAVFGIIVGVLLWMIFQPPAKTKDDHGKEEQNLAQNKQSTLSTKNVDKVMPAKQYSKPADFEVAASGNSVTTLSSTPGVIVKVDTESMEDVRKSFTAMASDYSQLVNHPPYSLPLESNQFDLLDPYAFSVTKRPMDSDNRYSFALSLEKTLLFHGDPIVVTLNIDANTTERIPNVVEIKTELLNKGKVVATITLEKVQDGAEHIVYKGQTAPSESQAESWSDEMTVRTKVLLQGMDEAGLTELFTYAKSVAKFIGKGSEKVEGSNLVIPLKFSVDQPGRFKVTANLYNAENGEPIAALLERVPFKSKDSEIPMKVHISVLRTKNSPGPYILKDINITRLPDELGGPTFFGSAPVGTQMDIKSFDLKQYQDDQYVNPDLLEKQKFLEQLGAPDTETKK